MKSDYRSTKEKTFRGKTFQLECFTEKYVQNLVDMDITSHYTPDVEPSGEGRNKVSPHVLLELDEHLFHYLKSITNKVNEKYFEMGGECRIGYLNLTDILDEILERELGDSDIEEKYMELMEEGIREEEIRRERKNGK